MKMKEMKRYGIRKPEQEKRLFGRCAAAGLAAAMVLSFAACGAGYEGVSPAYDKNGGMNYEAESYATDSYGYETADAGSAAPEEMKETFTAERVDNSAYYDNRKLIKTVNLDVETKEFDALLASVEEQVEYLGGYIESMNTYNGSRYTYADSARSSNLTVRIPKDQLPGFLDAVSEAGNVISRSENVEDVTLSYMDMESRKKSLQTEQERLLALLEVADNLEDILTIEERLSTVRYQLESMESQLRTYDNKVDFSTVYMSIQEVKELTPVEEETIGQRLANGFMQSLTDVKDGLVDFFVWFVVHIPYLAVWAFVIFIIVMIVKLCRRRSRIRKAAKLQMLRNSQSGQNMQNSQNAQNGQNMQNGQNAQSGQNMQNSQNMQNGRK